MRPPKKPVAPILSLVLLVLAVSAPLAQQKTQPVRVEKVNSGRAVSAEVTPAAASAVGTLDLASAEGLFDGFAHALEDEDAEGLRPLLAESDLRILLAPPGGNGDESPGGSPESAAAVYSREQAFFMLEDFFDENDVRLIEAQCRCPDGADGVDDAHGVLSLALSVGNATATSDLRLFLGMRPVAGRWQVVEIRALP